MTMCRICLAKRLFITALGMHPKNRPLCKLTRSQVAEFLGRKKTMELPSHIIIMLRNKVGY